jgi:hypothetical protein
MTLAMVFTTLVDQGVSLRFQPITYIVERYIVNPFLNETGHRSRKTTVRFEGTILGVGAERSHQRRTQPVWFVIFGQGFSHLSGGS